MKTMVKPSAKFQSLEDFAKQEKHEGGFVRVNTTEGMTGEWREIDKEKRQVEFVISSFRKDDYGTRFNPAGVDLSQYKKNPIVCWRHMRGTEDMPIIGKGLVDSFRVDNDGKMFMTAEFATEKQNPLAERVYNMIVSGFLNMASIGAQIVEEEFVKEEDGSTSVVFNKWKLFEWSVVPIGANDDALVSLRALEDEYTQPRIFDVGNISVVRDDDGKGIVTIEEPKENGTTVTWCRSGIAIPETDDQKKHREYFEQNVKVLKVYRNLLEKLYKRIGLVPPADEERAVSGMIDFVLPFKAEKFAKTPETREPTQAEMEALSMKLIERVKAREREALVSGVPLGKIKSLIPEWTREAIKEITS